jgi:hypothetical protein
MDGATFRLELEYPGACSLLLVGAREFKDLYLPLGWILRIGGWSLLPIELDNLEVGASYESILDIYKKTFCGFLPFGFPHKYWCNMFLM